MLNYEFKILFKVLLPLILINFPAGAKAFQVLEPGELFKTYELHKTKNTELYVDRHFSTNNYILEQIWGCRKWTQKQTLNKIRDSQYFIYGPGTVKGYGPALYLVQPNQKILWSAQLLLSQKHGNRVIGLWNKENGFSLSAKPLIHYNKIFSSWKSCTWVEKKPYTYEDKDSEKTFLTQKSYVDKKFITTFDLKKRIKNIEKFYKNNYPLVGKTESAFFIKNIGTIIVKKIKIKSESGFQILNGSQYTFKPIVIYLFQKENSTLYDYAIAIFQKKVPNKKQLMTYYSHFTPEQEDIFFLNPYSLVKGQSLKVFKANSKGYKNSFLQFLSW